MNIPQFDVNERIIISEDKYQYKNCCTLEELKRVIEEYSKKQKKEVWFYPAHLGVKGFFGTRDIFLLGLNPSSGTFPSDKDLALYNLLKEKKLENIHITDFIKVRAKNKQVSDLILDKDLMTEQARFFSNELNILKPKIIITLGRQCESLLMRYFPNIIERCQVQKIKHYSYRFQSRESLFEEISKQIDDILKESTK